MTRKLPKPPRPHDIVKKFLQPLSGKNDRLDDKELVSIKTKPETPEEFLEEFKDTHNELLYDIKKLMENDLINKEVARREKTNLERIREEITSGFAEKKKERK